MIMTIPVLCKQCMFPMCKTGQYLAGRQSIELHFSCDKCGNAAILEVRVLYSVKGVFSDVLQKKTRPHVQS